MPKVFAECQTLIAQGQLEEALARIEAVSESERQKPQWCEMRAFLATRQGDLAGAEEALRQAIAALPSVNNRLLLASNLHKQQRFAEARAVLLGVLQQEPSLAVAHFNVAQAYLAEGDYAAAQAPLEFCLEQQPDQVELLFQLATVHGQLNQPEAAQRYLQAVLRLSPYHVEALNNYGVWHLTRHDYPAAIHCFATAMRADEQHLPARSNLAGTLLQAKRYQEALQYYALYLDLAPEDRDATYNAGVAALMLEQLESASQYFQTVVTAIPSHVPSLLNLAAISLKRDEPSNALGFYQRVLHIEAEQPIAVYMVAALLGQSSLAKAPAAYVTALFDQYAANFDQHLLQGLDYQTPRELRRLYDRLVRSGVAKPQRLLDLGCGTGLSGSEFSQVAEEMIGVDLSAAMLAKAHDKHIYQQLHQADVIDYLQQVSVNFELIIAADVVVYFGDLQALLKAASERLAPQGLLLFSIENTAKAVKAPFVLTVSGRFQHRLEAIAEWAERVGLTLVASPTLTLRSQDKKPVTGTLIALQKA